MGCMVDGQPSEVVGHMPRLRRRRPICPRRSAASRCARGKGPVRRERGKRQIAGRGMTLLTCADATDTHSAKQRRRAPPRCDVLASSRSLERGPTPHTYRYPTCTVRSKHANPSSTLSAAVAHAPPPRAGVTRRSGPPGGLGGGRWRGVDAAHFHLRQPLIAVR